MSPSKRLSSLAVVEARGSLSYSSHWARCSATSMCNGHHSLAVSPCSASKRKKVVLLDEWHFDPDILPLPLQLLWLEGKPVPITLPQNTAGQSGHLMYYGDASIFITARRRFCAV